MTDLSVLGHTFAALPAGWYTADGFQLGNRVVGVFTRNVETNHGVGVASSFRPVVSGYLLSTGEIVENATLTFRSPDSSTTYPTASSY